VTRAHGLALLPTLYPSALMFRAPRVVLAAGAFAALPLLPAALRAQTSAAATPAAADSLAYPRQFVNWVVSVQGDSAFAHAGPALRESMKSPDAINGMAGRIAARFGEAKGTDAEVQFDEGLQKVYIAVMRFTQAPEPAAWVVVYSPITKIVERSSFGPLSNVKQHYPQAKLP
jgi:hypothetical protein